MVLEIEHEEIVKSDEGPSSELLIERLNDLDKPIDFERVKELYGHRIVEIARDSFDELNEKGANQMLHLLQDVTRSTDVDILFEILPQKTVSGSEYSENIDLCLSVLRKYPAEVREMLGKKAPSEAGEIIGTCAENIFTKYKYDIDPEKAFEYAADINNLSKILRLTAHYKWASDKSIFDQYFKKKLDESNVSSYGVNPEFLLQISLNPQAELTSTNYVKKILQIEDGGIVFFSSGFSFLTTVDSNSSEFNEMLDKESPTIFDTEDIAIMINPASAALRYEMLSNYDDPQIEERIKAILGIDPGVEGDLEGVYSYNLHITPKNNTYFVPTETTTAIYKTAVGLANFFEEEGKIKKDVPYMYGTTNERMALFALRFGFHAVAIKRLGYDDQAVTDEQFKDIGNLMLTVKRQAQLAPEVLASEKTVTDEDVQKLNLPDIDSVEDLELLEIHVYIVAKKGDVKSSILNELNPKRLAKLAERYEKRKATT